MMWAQAQLSVIGTWWQAVGGGGSSSSFFLSYVHLEIYKREVFSGKSVLITCSLLLHAIYQTTLRFPQC